MEHWRRSRCVTTKNQTNGRKWDEIQPGDNGDPALVRILVKANNASSDAAMPGVVYVFSEDRLSAGAVDEADRSGQQCRLAYGQGIGRCSGESVDEVLAADRSARSR